MSSPDLAAAQYTEDAPLWKGKSLPPVGSRIKVQHLGGVDGRIKTRTMYLTVGFEPTVDDDGDLRIPYRNDRDGKSYIFLLSDESLIDNWTLVGSAPVAALPEPAFEPIQEAANTDVPGADPTTLPGMLQRWLYVKDKITEAEALVKTLKAEKDALNAQIVNECIEQEYTKPPGVGDFTFSFRPVYFAEYLENEDGEKATTADVVAALKATGLDVGIVGESYNGNTLKAMLRERLDAGLALPEELAAVIKLASRSEVSVTRSATRNRRGRPAAIGSE